MNQRNGSTRFPPREVARSLGDFLHDVVTLAELQSKLLAVDVREAKQRLILPVILLAATMVITLGTVPVLLAALALGLMAVGLAPWLAFLLAAGIGLTVAGIAAAIAWNRLRRLTGVFGRSQEEFGKNVAWVKGAVTSLPENKARSQHVSP